MRIEADLPRLAPILKTCAAVAAGEEHAGVIKGDGSIGHVRNLALNPANEFDIGALHDLEDGNIRAVWHTHPEDQPPSAADVENCRATAVPWLIAGPSKVWCIHPAPPALTGREFVYGVEDCWQAVSDWWAERNVFLAWFERPAEGWWKDEGPSPYVENAVAWGFDCVPFALRGANDLAVGDVILMKIAGRRVNHAAVYVGGGEVFHHLLGHLSTIELFDGRMQKDARFVCRRRPPC